MTVQDIVLKRMQQLNISVRILAKMCGFKSYKKISNFVNKNIEKRTEMNFMSVVAICNVLFPEDPYEVLNKYALQVKKPMNKKAALEYCNVNSQGDTGYTLLESFKGDEELNEWAELYKIVFDRRHDEDENGELPSPESIIKRARGLRLRSPELKIMQNLLLAYSYQDLNKYHVCYEYLDGLNEDIKEIAIPYIKHAYQIRHVEIAGYISLRMFGAINTSREYCKELIDNSIIENSYKGVAYYILGTSYLFESLEKTIHYFKLSIESYQQSARKGAEVYLENYMIPLAYIFHNAFDKVETTNKSLLAYMNARMNNTELARIQLDQFLQENEDSAFTTFVEGLITKDAQLFLDSMSRYDLQGEMFLINIPRFAAIEFGIPKGHANGIIKYKMKDFEGVEEFEKTYYRNVSSLNGFRYKRRIG